MQSILVVILSALVFCGLWCLIRINHPKTPDEERALLEQDLKDLRKTMDERIARKEARHANLS